MQKGSRVCFRSGLGPSGFFTVAKRAKDHVYFDGLEFVSFHVDRLVEVPYNKYPLTTLLQDVDPNDQLEFIPSLLIMCDPMATLDDYFKLYESCVDEPRSLSTAYKNLVQE